MTPTNGPIETEALSVIIPVLNESARIDAALDALGAHPGLHEILVVDGGSTDDTVARAARHPHVRVLHAPCGRAAQMNAGAAAATGRVLLFLHVDVTLPADAPAWIHRALSHPDTVAGAFRTHTVPDGASPAWGPLLRVADIRGLYSRLPYGDQALFVRAGAFRRVGGFPPVALMEDLEIARRLWRVGRIRVVPAAVAVSGRRFTARPVYSTLVTTVFPLLYRLGVSPERLRDLYGHVR